VYPTFITPYENDYPMPNLLPIGPDEVKKTPRQLAKAVKKPVGEVVPRLRDIGHRVNATTTMLTFAGFEYEATLDFLRGEPGD
jgi:hypothetical protein